MKWGDVLIAAVDACCAVGPDQEVQPEELAGLVARLTEVSGGVDSVRAEPMKNKMQPVTGRKPDGKPDGVRSASSK